MEPLTNSVFLSLGSNLGDRAELLKRARERIHDVVGRITNQSSIYETTPWEMEEAPQFLNQVLQVNTPFSPHELLEVLLKIEIKLGRIRDPGCEIRDTRSSSYLSRIIDIDILFYGNDVIETSDLKIPHPLIPERRFVLVPLTEIAGEFVHPDLGKSIKELLASCKDSGEIKILGSN